MEKSQMVLEDFELWLIENNATYRECNKRD